MEKYEQTGVLGVGVGMVFMILAFSLAYVAMAGQDEVSIFGERFVRVAGDGEEVEVFGCLTSLDLNRDDLGTVIVLSRHCEGMGLVSSVYWNEDVEGNVYGVPICMRAVG